jgi:hypothetical protein
VPQLAEAEQEHRGGRLRAEVGVTWREAQLRERPTAQLVDELARFRVAPRIVAVGLGRRDGVESPAQGPRPQRRRLPAGGEHVAPEQSREGRHSGIEQPPSAVRRAQEIRLELPVPEVEQVVRRLLERGRERFGARDCRTLPPPRRPLPRPGSSVVLNGGCLPAAVEHREREVHLPHGAAVEPDRKRQAAIVDRHRDSCWRDREPKPAFRTSAAALDGVIPTERAPRLVGRS